ncbi:protein kinase [Actinomadura sp. NPDC048955]|uniref:serine/threonine-protein kinase n=1 Tax=Actinomadura sp. NPDC048955 TaxID=3158228 RepID=UPI0033CA4599
MAALETGVTLGGRFQLLEKLGGGAMGEVWRGVDRIKGRPIAVKTIRPDMLKREAVRQEALHRFFREGKAAGQLTHPNIVAVHHVIEDVEQPYLVMELLYGRDLRKELARFPRGLPVAQALEYGAQVASGLAVAHEAGVIHRDIKPENLMLVDGGIVKICDFGIARIAEASNALTRTGNVLGTPAYMPPEQLRGEPVKECSDLYALGATLFHLLTGRTVYLGDYRAIAAGHLTAPPPSISDLRPEVPPEVDHYVRSLLAKDPAARPSNATVVAHRLRVLGSGSTDPDPLLINAERLVRGTPGVEQRLAAMVDLAPRLAERDPSRAIRLLLDLLQPGPEESAEAGAGQRERRRSALYQASAEMARRAPAVAREFAEELTDRQEYFGARARIALVLIRQSPRRGRQLLTELEPEATSVHERDWLRAEVAVILARHSPAEAQRIANAIEPRERDDPRTAALVAVARVIAEQDTRAAERLARSLDDGGGALAEVACVVARRDPAEGLRIAQGIADFAPRLHTLILLAGTAATGDPAQARALLLQAAASCRDGFAALSRDEPAPRLKTLVEGARTVVAQLRAYDRAAAAELLCDAAEAIRPLQDSPADVHHLLAEISDDLAGLGDHRSAVRFARAINDFTEQVGTLLAVADSASTHSPEHVRTALWQAAAACRDALAHRRSRPGLVSDRREMIKQTRTVARRLCEHDPAAAEKLLRDAAEAVRGVADTVSLVEPIIGDLIDLGVFGAAVEVAAGIREPEAQRRNGRRIATHPAVMDGTAALTSTDRKRLYAAANGPKSSLLGAGVAAVPWLVTAAVLAWYRWPSPWEPLILLLGIIAITGWATWRLNLRETPGLGAATVAAYLATPALFVLTAFLYVWQAVTGHPNWVLLGGATAELAALVLIGVAGTLVKNVHERALPCYPTTPPRPVPTLPPAVGSPVPPPSRVGDQPEGAGPSADQDALDVAERNARSYLREPRLLALTLGDIALAGAGRDPRWATGLLVEAERTTRSESARLDDRFLLLPMIVKHDPPWARKLLAHPDYAALLRKVSGRSGVLREVAAAVADDDPQWARELLAAAAEMVRPRTFLSRLWNGSLPANRAAGELGVIAVAMARHDPDEAERIATLIRPAARFEQRRALLEVVRGIAGYDMAAAARIARSLPVHDREEALVDVAVAVIKADPAQAERIAGSLASGHSQQRALEKAVPAVAGQDAAEAERIARLIADPGQRAIPLVEIAQTAYNDDAQRARMLLDEAEQIAHADRSPYRRDQALVRVAVAMAKHDPAAAERIADSVTNAAKREDARMRIAVVIAEQDVAAAERIARSTGGDGLDAQWALDAALKGIAEVAAGRDPAAAERIARSIDAPAQRQSALMAIAVAAARHDVAEAERIALGISDRYLREQARADVVKEVAGRDPGEAARLIGALDEIRWNQQVIREIITAMVQNLGPHESATPTRQDIPVVPDLP